MSLDFVIGIGIDVGIHVSYVVKIRPNTTKIAEVKMLKSGRSLVVRLGRRGVPRMTNALCVELFLACQYFTNEMMEIVLLGNSEKGRSFL